MEFDVKIKIALPDEAADMLGIDEDSILESYYDSGFLYIRKVDDEELKELSRADTDESAECENCAMLCPNCGRCTLDD